MSAPPKPGVFERVRTGLGLAPAKKGEGLLEVAELTHDALMAEEAAGSRNLVEAQAQAAAAGCTAIKPNPKGRYRSPQGKIVDIRTFSVTSTPDGEVGDYGCPVAVRVFLEFHVGVAAALLLMIVYQIYPAIENQRRRDIRMMCRSDVENAPPECGYAGLNIRHTDDMPNLDTLSSYSMTTCSEYTNLGNHSHIIQPVRRSPAGDIFVKTPDAAYCSRLEAFDVHAWMSVPLVITWIVFMYLFARRMREVAKGEDEAHLTAGDYSVMIDGLPRHQSAAPLRLEERLVAEMKKEGYGELAGPPVIALHCAAEMSLMRSLADIKVERQEALAQNRLARKKLELEGANEAKLAAHEEREKKVIKAHDAALAAAREALRKKREEPALTTGHAFISFQKAVDRNMFVVAHRLRKKQPKPAGYDGVLLGVDGMEPCKIESAPEPNEILWENLELDSDYEIAARLVIYVVCMLLIGLGFGAIVWTRRQAGRDNFEDMLASVPIAGAESLEMLTTAVVSGVTVGINSLLFVVISFLNTKQGLDTLEAEQISLYTKLAVVYTCNTVLVPAVYGIAVTLDICNRPDGPVWGDLGGKAGGTGGGFGSSWSFGCSAIQQSWYEPGGVVSVVVSLAFSTGLLNSLMVAVPYDVLLARYVVAPFVSSRIRLNQLWQPTQMLLGDLYARLTMLLAIGLVYSPLEPLLLLAVLMMVGVNYAAVRCAISKWYAKPGNILFSLADRMKSFLGVLLFLHVLSVYFGGSAAHVEDTWNVNSPCLVTLFILVLWATVHFFGQWIPGHEKLGLQAYDEIEDALENGDDTKGVRFDAVFGIEKYLCPSARNLTVEEIERECFRRGFAGGYKDEIYEDLQPAKAADESTPLVAP